MKITRLKSLSVYLTCLAFVSSISQAQTQQVDTCTWIPVTPSCSKTCGGGSYVVEYLCSCDSGICLDIPKDAGSTRSCNTQPCPICQEIELANFDSSTNDYASSLGLTTKFIKMENLSYDNKTVYRSLDTPQKYTYFLTNIRAWVVGPVVGGSIFLAFYPGSKAFPYLTGATWRVQSVSGWIDDPKLRMRCNLCTGVQPPYYFDNSRGLCLPTSTCSSNNIELKAPTPTSDRICVPCSDACGQGTYNKDGGCFNPPFPPSCAPCHTTCKTCSGPLSSDCTSCSLENPFYLGNGTCAATCPVNAQPITSETGRKMCESCKEGTFYSSTGFGVCLPCASTCLSCSGPSDQECKVCAADLEMNSNNTCVPLPPLLPIRLLTLPENVDVSVLSNTLNVITKAVTKLQNPPEADQLWIGASRITIRACIDIGCLTKGEITRLLRENAADFEKNLGYSFSLNVEESNINQDKNSSSSRRDMKYFIKIALIVSGSVATSLFLTYLVARYKMRKPLQFKYKLQHQKTAFNSPEPELEFDDELLRGGDFIDQSRRYPPFQNKQSKRMEKERKMSRQQEDRTVGMNLTRLSSDSNEMQLSTKTPHTEMISNQSERRFSHCYSSGEFRINEEEEEADLSTLHPLAESISKLNEVLCWWKNNEFIRGVGLATTGQPYAWFLGVTSTNTSRCILAHSLQGSFHIRISRNFIGYILSVKGSSDVQDYLLYEKNGKYRLSRSVGGGIYHKSLRSLVNYHYKYPLPGTGKLLHSRGDKGSSYRDLISQVRALYTNADERMKIIDEEPIYQTVEELSRIRNSKNAEEEELYAVIEPRRFYDTIIPIPTNNIEVLSDDEKAAAECSDEMLEDSGIGSSHPSSTNDSVDFIDREDIISLDGSTKVKNTLESNEKLKDATPQLPFLQIAPDVYKPKQGMRRWSNYQPQIITPKQQNRRSFPAELLQLSLNKDKNLSNLSPLDEVSPTAEFTSSKGKRLIDEKQLIAPQYNIQPQQFFSFGPNKIEFVIPKRNIPHIKSYEVMKTQDLRYQEIRPKKNNKDVEEFDESDIHEDRIYTSMRFEHDLGNIHSWEMA